MAKQGRLWSRMVRTAVVWMTRRVSALTGAVVVVATMGALLVPGAGAASANQLNVFSLLPAPGSANLLLCQAISTINFPHVQGPVQETDGAIAAFQFPVAETQSLISGFLLFAESCLPPVSE